MGRIRIIWESEPETHDELPTSAQAAMAAKWLLERGNYRIAASFTALAAELASVEADDYLQRDLGNAVQREPWDTAGRVTSMGSYQPRTVQTTSHEAQALGPIAPMPGGPADVGHAGTHPYVDNPFRHGHCRYQVAPGGLCDAPPGDLVHDERTTPVPGEERP